MKRIKKDDTVIVIAGKNKGHIGKILKVFKNKVIVAGANIIHKCIKAQPQKNITGQIIQQEAAIDVSNVAIYNQALDKADKVKFGFYEKNGQQVKARYFKSNNELIDVI